MAVLWGRWEKREHIEYGHMKNNLINANQMARFKISESAKAKAYFQYCIGKINSCESAICEWPLKAESFRKI